MGDEFRVQTEQSEEGGVVVVHSEELVLEVVEEREAELHEELVPTLDTIF